MNGEAGVCIRKISKSFLIQPNSTWICLQKHQKWIFLANEIKCDKTIFRHLRCPFGQPGADCAPFNVTEPASLKYKAP